MLTSSFIFARGMSEEVERTLWSKGITTWDLARKHLGEVGEIIGQSRAQKLAEQVAEAQAALARCDHAWFKANWPEKETWRLWQGMCGDDHIALVDIETTGLTPGYDQITVIGLADGKGSRVFVAGRPQPGDEPLDRFREAIRAYRMVVTFNGANFDVPFIEKQFREAQFRIELPHIDLMHPARSLGLGGGLKDIEKQLGIVRADDIKDVRGNQAIHLWGQWKSGDSSAYARLTTYCKADCANLKTFADEIYRRKWQQVYTPHARVVDFERIKGEQQTLLF